MRKIVSLLLILALLFSLAACGANEEEEPSAQHDTAATPAAAHAKRAFPPLAIISISMVAQALAIDFKIFCGHLLRVAFRLA